MGSFAGSYVVGYLNGFKSIHIQFLDIHIPGLGASYLFMAASLFLSAMLTIVAVKSSGKLHDQTADKQKLADQRA